MNTLETLLEASAIRHAHLCPKQVLGVRMGVLAGRVLGIEVPQHDKRLLAIVETDGCTADGVAVATGCSIGHRTLRIEDYGKVAATFVDTVSERALRIIPRPEARGHAAVYADDEHGKWKTQLIGYQRMPDEALFSWHEVRLVAPIAAIISRPHTHATCQTCGEDVINEREVVHEGSVLCRACAGESYYQPAP